MNKEQIIQDISSETFCTRLVGEATKTGNETDIAIYRQSYLEVSGDSAMVKSTSFYVVDEGLETEQAYYVSGQKPKSTVEAVVLTEEAALIN